MERPWAWPGVGWGGYVYEFLCTDVAELNCWNGGGSLVSCLSEVLKQHCAPGHSCCYGGSWKHFVNILNLEEDEVMRDKAGLVWRES